MGPPLTALVAACAMANAGTVSAFAPPGLAVSARSRFVPANSWTSRSSAPAARPSASGARGLQAMVDPGMLHGVDPAWLHQVLTGIADGDVAAAVADEAAKGGGGGFHPIELLTGVTEGAITGLHDVLASMGVPSAYGISIICFTLFVKGITFPLTYQQLSSTTKMQTLGPKVKELQARYANNPEAANQAVQQLYQTENVNPLAGCLPALAQIPIFISLYRSLLNLAKENKLTESFLWIPSLEGPTFDSPPTDMMSWIKDWSDGAPKLGWHDTIAYMTIPIILVITQSISTRIMQPAKDPSQPVDESQAASQNASIVKFLPLMIGWFSLSVPSALGLYWILNNFISTATSVFIRNQIANETGDPNMKAPKITLPFMEEEPEVVTMPIPREALPDSAAVEETKGFVPTPATLDAEVEGEIVQEDGAPAPRVSTASAKTPKGSKKKKKKRARK
ncbi:unnamed protein product [Ectocarpus sp. 13 AM-2016]